MANVIIGIHGLGNKPPKSLLEQWWRLAMTEGLKSNGVSSVLPKFEMVYWADIVYDKPLNESEKDLTSQYYIDERYSKAPEYFPLEDHETRKKIVDFLGRQMNRLFLNDDLTLNYTFITDTIVNKYFKDLEFYYKENYTGENGEKHKASEVIRERLLRILEEHSDDDIMLISHSMGSIIAFDVLAFVAPHLTIKTFITMGSPLGIPVVISKIASEQKLRGNVTTHMITPPGIVGNWYNFSDILDKVAFNYKLSDDFSENTFRVKPSDFLVVNTYEMNGIRNPHKSYGYLRTPEFSKILNEFILAEKLTLKEKVNRKILQIFNNIKSWISIQKERIKTNLTNE